MLSCVLVGASAFVEELRDATEILPAPAGSVTLKLSYLHPGNRLNVCSPQRTWKKLVFLNKKICGPLPFQEEIHMCPHCASSFWCGFRLSI